MRCRVAVRVVLRRLLDNRKRRSILVVTVVVFTLDDGALSNRRLDWTLRRKAFAVRRLLLTIIRLLARVRPTDRGGGTPTDGGM